MSDIKKTISYLRKIEQVLIIKPIIPFFKYNIVKKEDIDDLLCCFLTTLPPAYEHALSDSTCNRDASLHSIIAYVELLKSLRNSTFLGQSYIVINKKKAAKLIKTIINSIRNDIQYLEK